jgi:acyl-CoA thioesterase-1
MRIRLALLLFVTFLWGACNNQEKKSTDIRNEELKDSSATVQERQNILFFGNSLTAGYGLDNPEDAFPGLIQQKIDSLGLRYMTINAGLSGETSAGGNARIEWLLKQKIAVFILELGANDGLRGIPVEETEKNLQEIIDKVKNKYPDCKMVLTGMMVPPNMGADYSTRFGEIFPRLARNNNMNFMPFLLDGVAGDAALNQKDGIHPTVEGQRIIADNLWKIIAPLL